MNREQAAQILAYCAQSWPTMSVGEHTVDVWAEALAMTAAHDAQTAVRQLVKTDDYPPTVARIISAARGIAKGHAEYRAIGSGQTNRAESARAMAALNVLYAQMDRPAHDHHKGRDGCPACSTKADRLKVFAHEAADLLGDYGISIDPDRAARYAIDGHAG